MSIQLFCATYDIDSCLEQIRECLEIGWTGMGFKTVEFEKVWKDYTSLNNAYFTNSATGALNLAVDTLKEVNGWMPGDEIITTPLTFVSTNHAILKYGLTPVFADVDSTLCLDPKDVELKITDKTKAIMYVGFGGNTGKYNEIVNIAKRNNLKLILDAAHMAGTRLNGSVPGTEADAVIYSFQAVKNLPTGDSGMLCMKDSICDEIARKKAWLGINKDTYNRSTHNQSTYKWKYDVEYLGEKYNGNSIMAAIALAQFPHLDEDNEYRRKIAEWYMEGLDPVKDRIKYVEIPEECLPSRHLFQIIVDDRDGLLEYLNQNDIYPGVHYTPNTDYGMYNYAKGTCKYADYIGEHILSLPIHMRIKKNDVDFITSCIKSYITK